MYKPPFSSQIISFANVIRNRNLFHLYLFTLYQGNKGISSNFFRLFSTFIQPRKVHVLQGFCGILRVFARPFSTFFDLFRLYTLFFRLFSFFFRHLYSRTPRHSYGGARIGLLATTTSRTHHLPEASQTGIESCYYKLLAAYKGEGIPHLSSSIYFPSSLPVKYQTYRF